MGKILLSSYMNRNLGDDIMVELLIKQLSNHTFYIIADKNVRDAISQPKNVFFIDPITPTEGQFVLRGINKILSYLRIPKIQIIKHFSKQKYDAYLQYGGSIFIQVTDKSWINKVRDYKWIAKRVPKNVIIGCNFGPYYSHKFMSRHKEMFKMFDAVTFRDEYSYKLFKDLEIARVGADIVFNLNLKNVSKDYIIISMINIKNRKGLSMYLSIYERFLFRLIGELSKEKEVVLMSFCENEGDLSAINDFIFNFKLKEKIKVFNHKTVEESLLYLQRASAIVASRFHAMILGIIMKVPILPIIYSEKMSHELDDLDYKGMRLYYENLENTDIHDCLLQLESPSKVNNCNIETSKIHFDTLKMLLNNDK